MGAQGSRKEGVLESSNPNGKKLDFLIELCSSWRFGSDVANVEKFLFKELNNQGYEIKYVFEPIQGGNGEYNIYENSLNGKRLVFSNNKNLKERQTVIGRNINGNNLKEIIDAIMN